MNCCCCVPVPPCLHSKASTLARSTAIAACAESSTPFIRAHSRPSPSSFVIALNAYSCIFCAACCASCAVLLPCGCRAAAAAGSPVLVGRSTVWVLCCAVLCWCWRLLRGTANTRSAGCRAARAQACPRAGAATPRGLRRGRGAHTKTLRRSWAWRARVHLRRRCACAEEQALLDVQRKKVQVWDCARSETKQKLKKTLLLRAREGRIVMRRRDGRPRGRRAAHQQH